MNEQTLMTKKRKMSIDETDKANANTCLQSSLKKAKKHINFDLIFQDHTVLELKTMVRDMGYANWYTLRKKNLVCSVIVYEAVNTIINFLRKISEKKRVSLIENCGQLETCPISLEKIHEVNDPYVHDGVIFSQKSLTDYLLSSYDFLNPITRKPFHLADIRRFDSNVLLQTFRNKDKLRKNYVESVNHFSFLEMEIEHIMINLLHMYSERASEEFDECVVAFGNTFSRMLQISRNRTLCVMESLLDRFGFFHPRISSWGEKFVKGFIDKIKTPS